jgi:hypothetical protein
MRGLKEEFHSAQREITISKQFTHNILMDQGTAIKSEIKAVIDPVQIDAAQIDPFAPPKPSDGATGEVSPGREAPAATAEGPSESASPAPGGEPPAALQPEKPVSPVKS